jgi:hypothetical protein
MSVAIAVETISVTFICFLELFWEEKTYRMQTNPLHEADAQMDAQVDALYRTVKGRINWDNLIPTCLELARELEGLTHLRGKERLELLQKTLRFALKDSDKSAEEKEQILHTIDTVVPMVMQAAVLSSKIPIAAQVLSCCWKK